MKKLVFVLIIMSVFISIHAKYSDAFLNGVYSQYQLRYVSGTPQQVGGKFDALGLLLHDAGFNAVHFEMIRDDQIKNDALDLQYVLPALDNNHIDAILYDLCWNDASNSTQYPDPKVGLASLSFANYMKMEAEYKLSYNGTIFIPDTLGVNDDSADDTKNYVFAHDTGNRKQSDGVNQFSNGYTWECLYGRDSAGLAVYNPRFRWKPSGELNPRSIGYDLLFFNSGDAHPCKENQLYLRVALKWAGNLAPDIPIAHISLVVAKSSVDIYTAYDPINHPTNYVTLTLHPDPDYEPSSQRYGTELFSQDITDITPNENNFRVFEYYVDLPEPGTTSYNEILAGGYFNNINPQIFWHGNTTLTIDYIEFEDKFHRSMRLNPNNSEYLVRLGNRLSQIDGYNATTQNIAYYYTYDEPFQGSFDAFNRLQTYMNLYDKKILTAVYTYDSGVVKPNQLSTYFHPGNFLSSAIPKSMIIDAYPLTESPTNRIQWNSNDDPTWGVQNRMQNIVLDKF